ncbi:serine hydrolase [Cyclobacterium xiamenense]|uniref:serine hydrolase n=1 Tax=Cyclobacterium xiamenense TaxID=1297121 RepID=UPI0035D0116E
MKKSFSSFARYLLVVCVCQWPVSLANGQGALQEYLETLAPETELSFLIQSADGTRLAEYHPDKQIPSASIIKIPILLTLLEAVEKDELSLDDRYRLRSQDKVGGAGALQFQADGSLLTYRTLASEMIRISDNTATNILIDKLGMERIQDWLKGRGFTATQLNRKMMDFAAIEQGKQNYTSPGEINQILLMLLDSKSVSAETAASARQLLAACEDRQTLPARLPQQLEVAHKTGTLDYVRGDAGIIFGKQPLVISVFVEHFQEIEEAEKIIAEIGRLAYESYGN